MEQELFASELDKSGIGYPYNSRSISLKRSSKRSTDFS